MAAHRYWRIRVTSTAGGLSPREFEMYATVGGTDICVGGVAVGMGTPANAFDNTATLWEPGGSLAPNFIICAGYDFGVGNAVEPVQIGIHTSQWANEWPTGWVLEWSDTGAGYTEYARWSNVTTGWAPNTLRKFTVVAATRFTSEAEHAAAHRYWRLLSKTPFLRVAELELRASVGGADLTSPITAISASSAGGANPASMAIDDNTGTEFSCTNQYNQWLRVDFGVGVTRSVREVAIRPSVSGNDKPTSCILQWSDDDATWYDAAVHLSVTIPNGALTAFAGAPAAADPLSIVSVTPNHGPTAGGTRVRIVTAGGA